MPTMDYDSGSAGYPSARRADPRIARWIHDALGDAERVLNVGAGTGNYEPTGRFVVAVEPAPGMLAQRASSAAPAVRAVAEWLPFPADCFDVAMAVLTLHHWSDLAAGLREMARVAPRQVLFVYEPAVAHTFWLTEWFPEARAVPSERQAPGPADVARYLTVEQVDAVAIPADCTDGFGAAYWARPEAYLDPRVQQAQSWLAQLPADVLARRTAALAADLASGAWDERLGHLRSGTELDVGYRLVRARRA